MNVILNISNKLITNNHLNFLVLFLLVFLTQFSSINIEVIDWDESTFYIISKYVSNGDILYQDYWDGKPPIIFFYLGLVFKLFGPSLLVGRLAGDFVIFLTIVMIYKILNIFYQTRTCFFTSLFLIFLYSYDASQPTMTEHLGIFFIVASIYLVFKKSSNKNLFYIGVLFSLAFNTRNNLAFACVAIAIYLLYINKVGVNNFIYLILGFLSVILAISFYFIINKSLKNYFYMLLEFPFQTTQSYRMNLDEFLIQITSKFNLEQKLNVEISIIILIIFLIFFVVFTFSKQLNKDLFILNSLVSFFIALSIVFGGRLFNHYLIQLFPFISIYFAFLLNVKKKFAFNFILYAFAVLLNLGLINKGLNNINNYQIIKNDYVIQNISKEIKISDETTKFLALENHLIFFYNDMIKPFKVVHPSGLPNTTRNQKIFASLKKLNIVKDNEFRNFLDAKPDYIFCEKECNQYIKQEFFENYYTLLIEKNNLKLFQKNKY